MTAAANDLADRLIAIAGEAAAEKTKRRKDWLDQQLLAAEFLKGLTK